MADFLQRHGSRWDVRWDTGGDRATPEQGSGIAQYAVWVALSEAGIGASLQHYNPLPDAAVAARWGVPASWKLRAQMPFGSNEAGFGEKGFIDNATRYEEVTGEPMGKLVSQFECELAERHRASLRSIAAEREQHVDAALAQRLHHEGEIAGPARRT